MLLGETDLSWSALRTLLTNSNSFFKSLLNLDLDKLPAKLIIKIKKNWLSKPEYHPEEASRKSQAAGILLRWVSAVVEYHLSTQKTIEVVEVDQILEPVVEELQVVPI